MLSFCNLCSAEHFFKEHQQQIGELEINFYSKDSVNEFIKTTTIDTYEIIQEELFNKREQKSVKTDKKTDEIYDLFYTPLALRQDRSDASKVALLDSQRIKVEMINALAGLASAKAKLEMAKQKQIAGNTGIYVNTQSGSEVGISLSNLWDATK